MLHIGGDLLNVEVTPEGVALSMAYEGICRKFITEIPLQGINCARTASSTKSLAGIPENLVSNVTEKVRDAELKLQSLEGTLSAKKTDDVYVSANADMMLDDVEAEVVAENINNEKCLTLLKVTNMQDTDAWGNTYLLLSGGEVVNIGKFTGDVSMRSVRNNTVEVFSATEKKRLSVYELGRGFICVSSNGKLATVITTMVNGQKAFYKSHSLEDGTVRFLKTEKGAKRFYSIEDVHNTIEELACIKPGVAFTYDTV